MTTNIQKSIEALAKERAEFRVRRTAEALRAVEICWNEGQLDTVWLEYSTEMLLEGLTLQPDDAVLLACGAKELW